MSEKKIEVTFVGIDDFNRPIFKDENRNYYGSTDKLFDYTDTMEEVLSVVTEEDLCYFGRKFGCEPMGDHVDNLVIKRD